jgi:hypothetical protein
MTHYTEQHLVSTLAQLVVRRVKGWVRVWSK